MMYFGDFVVLALTLALNLYSSTNKHEHLYRFNTKIT